MLLKGLAEVQEAGAPLAAAEMVLVRIAYAADLPTPDEVIRSLGENGAAPARRRGTAVRSARPQAFAPRYEAPRGAPRLARAGALSPRRSPDPAAAPRSKRSPRRRCRINTFRGADRARRARSATSRPRSALERDVRLVRCEDGQLEIALEPSARKTLVQRPAAQADRMDRPALDGGRLDGSRARRRCSAQTEAQQAEIEQRRARRSAGAGGARRASRAPRSSACATRRRAAAAADGRRAAADPDDYGADDDEDETSDEWLISSA